MHCQRIIYIDRNANETLNEYVIEHYGLKSGIDIATATTIEDGLRLIKNTAKAVVIISGFYGEVLLPKINNFKNLKGVVIFCENV